MRIRQIRPGFVKDRVVASWPLPSRLLYVLLWMLADDAGWLEWDLVEIGAELFPYESAKYRERHLPTWAAPIVESGRVVLHDCGCAQIPKLPDHQKIGGRQSFSCLEYHREHHVQTGTEPSVPVHDGTPRARTPTLTITNTLPEGGLGGDGLHHVTPNIAGAWERASGKSLLGSGAFAQDYLDDAARRHPEGRVVDAIGRAWASFSDHVPSTQQLAAAVRAILDPLPSSKSVQSAEAERRAQEASQRREANTLRQLHFQHGEPHPRCPLCGDAA